MNHISRRRFIQAAAATPLLATLSGQLAFAQGKHYELRTRHELAPAAFYNWGNAIGDPSTSTGFSMFTHSPHSAWKSKDIDDQIGPLWGEKDEKKRIEGYKKVDRYIAEKTLVIPLLQYHQPVVYRKGLKFTPHTAGFILPQDIKPA